MSGQVEAGTCPCGRDMVQQHAWANADERQRDIWRATRTTVLQGRGLCRACYQRARKQGLIPPRQPLPTRLCDRCGIATVDELCRDCVEVLAMDGAA